MEEGADGCFCSRIKGSGTFLMLFFWLVVSRCRRQPSAPQLMMTCVCRSSPVTMLPTVRSAGTSTDGDWCL